MFSAYMKSLQEKHLVIKDLIGQRSILYIDVPMYMNSGDHLIAHGTFKFFENNNIEIARASCIDWYKVRWISDTDVLVFGGGGNFGDLWPGIHRTRMKLVKEALDRGKTVIVLPQSLWYEDDKNRSDDVKIINKHPNFFLFTRDSQSYEIGKTISKNVYLVPDMAHHLYDELSTFVAGLKPSKEVLHFLRDDKEALPGRDSFVGNQISYDWSDVLKINDCAAGCYRTFRLYKWMRRLHMAFFDKKLNLWRKNSWHIVLTGAKFFSQYETIQTDRLHGMIFASLLNRNFEIIDNSYGKVSGYKNAWLDTIG